MFGSARRILWILSFQAALLAILIAILVALGGVTSGAQDGNAKPDSRALALQVVDILRSNYVDPVNPINLLKAYEDSGTISGMLAVLKDPYTAYMDPKAFKHMQEFTAGSFEGIGILIELDGDKLTIIRAIEGTPAERVGLQPGDHIIFIDGKPAKGMALDYAVSLMRGPKGTPVVLGIERAGAKGPFDVRIIRDKVRLVSVRGTMLEGQLGYVELAAFSEGTAEELDKELDLLERQGMKGLILDLRYNGGGLLSEGIKVANRFIPKGPLVHIIERSGERTTVYSWSTPAKQRSRPMMVLVNELTASASEIVAGALQDLGIATLVGTRTFGKGVVMTIYDLSDGSAISVTTARYLTAGGRSIHQKGIDPDVSVELPKPASGAKAGGQEKGLADKDREFKDTQLERAIEELKKKLASGPVNKAQAKAKAS